MAEAKAELLDALRRHSLRTGEFTLASGRTSSWYLDARQVTFPGRLCRDRGLGGDGGGGEPGVRRRRRAHSGCRSGGPGRPPRRPHPGGGRRRDHRGSTLQAVEAVAAYGGVVVGASCLLDRGGELGPALDGLGIPFFPVLGAPDLGFEFGS